MTSPGSRHATWPYIKFSEFSIFENVANIWITTLLNLDSQDIVVNKNDAMIGQGVPRRSFSHSSTRGSQFFANYFQEIIFKLSGAIFFHHLTLMVYFESKMAFLEVE
ncbi:unnamed protein product [Orchesella dallaii]|uniref:Uncharacterized protein n=1 Tax=Orchesella dallaii TaxID=48710 RepID=A0ABP1S021_9HEXA